MQILYRKIPLINVTLTKINLTYILELYKAREPADKGMSGYEHPLMLGGERAGEFTSGIYAGG